MLARKPTRRARPAAHAAPPGPQTGVRLTDVGHRFRQGPWLFTNITLELHPGHVYALTGPSGSGKSTLLSLLAGWEQPAHGSIEHPANAGRTRWVFQNPYGVAARTALDHVALPLLAAGHTPTAADEHAHTLLKRFGLAHAAHRPYRSLSGGEAQRLMIARGVASQPALFLVDEPTAQLDLATAAEVNTALAALAGNNDADNAVKQTIVVVATHDERTRDACTDHIDLRDYQPSQEPRAQAGHPAEPAAEHQALPPAERARA